MACGASFDVKSPEKAGPEVTESITVPTTGSEETRLILKFGAGSLKLSPGADDFVEGTAVYNFEQLKPEVTINKGEVTIENKNFENIINPKDLVNSWDLKLGDSPMDLEINAGAYNGRFELGGLAITTLTVKDGASDVELSFSESNLTDMSILRYETGASRVTLSGLANANFSTLMFSGGAGTYELDFSGDLQQNGTVTVEAGAGDVHLVIPRDVNAKVTVESALVSINHSTNWSQNGATYSQDGKGPTLTIIVKMAAGSLAITD
jgi:DUF4097 and DUF4098 domain-containing protein YvlB